MEQNQEDRTSIKIYQSTHRMLLDEQDRRRRIDGRKTTVQDLVHSLVLQMDTVGSLLNRPEGDSVQGISTDVENPTLRDVINTLQENQLAVMDALARIREAVERVEKEVAGRRDAVRTRESGRTTKAG